MSPLVRDALVILACGGIGGAFSIACDRYIERCEQRTRAAARANWSAGRKGGL